MTEPRALFTEADRLAEEIAARYLPQLRLFAARRLGDATAADDAAQETLRRVLEALRQGRVKDLQALPSYTFETARHVCQHLRRTSARQVSVEDADAAEAVADPTVDPLTALVSAERIREVRNALSTLDDGDRELIRLSFAEGQASDVIASRLGLTPGNVRVRRHRILRKLGALLSVTSRPPAEPLE